MAAPLRWTKNFLPSVLNLMVLDALMVTLVAGLEGKNLFASVLQYNTSTVTFPAPSMTTSATISP